MKICSVTLMMLESLTLQDGSCIQMCYERKHKIQPHNIKMVHVVPKMESGVHHTYSK